MGRLPPLKAHQAPLYLQLAGRLRDQIGTLDHGTRIQSEPQLAKAWGVSRFTVARAVEQLVEEGLVTRRQGSGSFVAQAPLRRAPGYLLSFTEAVEAAGHVASQRLLAFGPAAWEDGLPYPPGKPLVLLDRLRLVDNRPVARHRSVLSAESVAATGLTRAIAENPGFSLYRHFGEHGLSPFEATERLVARAPEGQERELLGLGGEGVVVAVARHSFAAGGLALDAVQAVYDARRYSYEAHLLRAPRPLHDRETTETRDEKSLADGRGHSGPRLGPWSS